MVPTKSELLNALKLLEVEPDYDRLGRVKAKNSIKTSVLMPTAKGDKNVGNKRSGSTL
mgnify:FL=1